MKRRAEKILKKVFDMSTAAVGGVLTAPVLLICMAIVHKNSPEAPAIFRQTRIGYGGKPFTMYKLRTMTSETDENGELLPDELRQRKWGEVFRTLNVDELPQMWNILRGDMSFIGPRPLLPHEMEVMTPKEQAERQSMLPGVTGWEAVNEAKSDSRRRMAEYDLEYVRNWSLGFDLKIAWKTVVLLVAKGRAEDAFRAPKLREEEIIHRKRR